MKGEPMNFDAVTAVQDDISQGLAGAFTIDSGGIRVDSPLNEKLLENNTYAAVVWSLTATHTGPFVGLEATGREVTIEGVTLVQKPTSKTEQQFMRYIDWSAVLGQLGVSMSGRPILAN
jgi:SnoaL-like polyketide cyclase